MGEERAEATEMTASTRRMIGGREIVAVVSLLAAFILVNLATMVRFPTVWQDEVEDADVAANLYFGNGFTSTAYSYSSEHEIFPLRPLPHCLLFGWLSVFGFSIYAVRSYYCVVWMVGALAIWGAVARFRLVRTAPFRLVLLLLLLCGNASCIVYRTGRYDCTGAALLGIVFLVLSIQSQFYRRLLLAACGLLLGLAGAMFIPYMALMSLVVLFLLGPGYLVDVACTALGGLLGLIGWMGVLHSHHELSHFFQVIESHRKVKGGLGGDQWGYFWEAVTYASRWSINVLAVGFAVGLLSGNVRRRLGLRSPTCFGLFFLVAIPLAMVVGGRYHGNYVWMTFLPMSVCFAVALEREYSNSRIWRGLEIAVAGLVCMAGLVLGVAMCTLDWNERDYSAVDAFVARYVRPDDSVYCANAVYYPVKRLAKEMWVGPGYATMTQKEKDRVSLIFVQSYLTYGDILSGDLRHYLGGQWQRVGSYRAGRSELRKAIWPYPKTAFFYKFDVYRRLGRPAQRAIAAPPPHLQSTEGRQVAKRVSHDKPPRGTQVGSRDVRSQLPSP